MTEIYLHSIGEAERDAMRVLDCETVQKPHTETKKDPGETS